MKYNPTPCLLINFYVFGKVKLDFLEINVQRYITWT